MPVTGGRQNPPQNRTSQSNATNAEKDVRNGIGIVQNAAIILTIHYTFYAFFEL